MTCWHDIWKWETPATETEAEECPFWDLTAPLRKIAVQTRRRAKPPERLLISMIAEGCPVSRRLTDAFSTLGERRLGRDSLLRLQAVCGHIKEPAIHILRLGNADIRLSLFPTTFLFAFLPLEKNPLSGTNSSLCRLVFQALILGAPPGDPVVWWAHLGEGRSVWDPSHGQQTVKVSVSGEVVRTLAAVNEFRQDFMITL